jgi:hypothetical protein
MELCQFIQNNQIVNFSQLKQILENAPFMLNIKEDPDFQDLFLIYKDNYESINNILENNIIKIIKECNGIIMNKNTLSVVCYTFDKCNDSNIINPNLNLDNIYIENSIEGALIRLHCYNNNWILSTKKCIDARKSKWLSDKSFAQLFEECIMNIDIQQNLNKNCCYSFIIKHPENNMVIKYTDPQLIHISTIDLTTLKEIYINIGVQQLVKTKINKDDIMYIFNNCHTSNVLDDQGYILIDNNFTRQKIKKHIYIHAKNLWGNTNNRCYRYLELRKDYDKLVEYLKYFPNDKDLFQSYEIIVSNIAKDILKQYVDKHITRVITKVPFFYVKIIYQLHGDFTKSKVKTNYNKVMNVLFELEPKNLCFIINNYKKYINEIVNNSVIDYGVHEMNISNEVEMIE